MEEMNGRDFFNILLESEEFTIELGKMVLAAGRLEAEIMSYFIRKGIAKDFQELTLGQLISMGERNQAFEKNFLYALKDIKKQRNYLTHNIYSLLTDKIEETILERQNIIDTDIMLYKYRAWQLRVNLESLADIVHKQ